MVSPVQTEVVIKCPHCGTRYHLPAETLGAKGRDVSCAHCGGTWRARPMPSEDEAVFDADAEAELDASFAEEERRLRSVRPVDPSSPSEPAVPPGTGSREGRLGALGDVQRKFLKRQARIRRSLPMAKAQRAIRVIVLAALLTLIGGGIIFRTAVVRAFPDLAGVYEALGLSVNIVGLDFGEVKTLVSLREGSPVLRVDGKIQNVASRRIVVPPMRVTLLDEGGGALYEWSTATEIRELLPGEALEFTTQLVSPPSEATRVRLSFTDGRSSAAAPVTATLAESE